MLCPSFRYLVSSAHKSRWSEWLPGKTPVLVMFQEGKDKKLSGAIAGGSDNFLSGIKGNGKDKLLSTLTAALSVVFAVLAVVLYVIVG